MEPMNKKVERAPMELGRMEEAEMIVVCSIVGVVLAALGGLCLAAFGIGGLVALLLVVAAAGTGSFVELKKIERRMR